MAPKDSKKSKSKKQQEEPQGLGKSRALLLMALVVVGTGAAMFLMGGDDGQAQSQPADVDDSVVEVAPLIPPGKISNASWQTNAQRERDLAVAEENAEEEGSSLLDSVQWKDDEARSKYEKSLERTVDEIHGLGIYVAPLEDAKKKKK